MKESDDIANLFRQFGGKPSDYQEISRAANARESRERWPLLNSVDAERAADAPAVGSTPAQSQDAPRLEPHLPAAAPAPDAAAPVKRAGEFIPPQPRSLRSIPPAFTRPLTESESAAEQAASQPAARPAAAAPAPVFKPAPAQAAAAGTELQQIFARLSQSPAPAPDPDNRSASLLQRLNRP